VSIVWRYRDFARTEARGRSPRYEALAEAVADDVRVLAFLEGLPAGKRQPNLLFAAARYLLGETADIGSLRDLVGDDLREVMLTRRTQTNEVARCATLLPALAMIDGPLALLEVGASAGLTLLPDRYSYDYGNGRVVEGSDPLAPVLSCEPRGPVPVPVPARVPEVIWRAGLDLNPLDVTDEDDVRWLECLLWPGEQGRAERLAAAIATARRDPPAVHRGDLLTGVPAIAAQAPPEATLVIYHSAVLAYVDERGRREFASVVKGMGVAWLSNEEPGVVGSYDAPGGFALIRDGGQPLAVTDPHGTWVRWMALRRETVKRLGQ
jgi:hypothetical protein